MLRKRPYTAPLAGARQHRSVGWRIRMVAGSAAAMAGRGAAVAVDATDAAGVVVRPYKHAEDYEEIVRICKTICESHEPLHARICNAVPCRAAAPPPAAQLSSRECACATSHP